MPSLNNCVRLTSGHRNSLKMFQTVNSQSAYNAYNSLNYLDYNESLELANSLIIPFTLTLAQKNVKHSFLNNQHVADLQDSGCNPDLPYERVVTESPEVNQPSLSESVNQSSLRGGVTYKNFVGQRLCGTQRLAQSLQVTKNYSPNDMQSSMLITTKFSLCLLTIQSSSTKFPQKDTPFFTQKKDQPGKLVKIYELHLALNVTSYGMELPASKRTAVPDFYRWVTGWSTITRCLSLSRKCLCFT